MEQGVIYLKLPDNCQTTAAWLAYVAPRSSSSTSRKVTHDKKGDAAFGAPRKRTRPRSTSTTRLALIIGNTHAHTLP